MSITAKLRVCASCEWVFRIGDNPTDCPKCGFGHYGARYVYGTKAYGYETTQEPWKKKKLDNYELRLLEEIDAAKPPRKQHSTSANFPLATPSEIE